ncbi:MAG: 4Fe-4S binding protein [Oscillospiraceae bacterium]|jgi:formate hydrogenlyase subunit 6/NADH:ubiquinone oxidoreductase subunit I|nr:4Fe-4S binding protein [Oscillospiraceae bacterium]
MSLLSMTKTNLKALFHKPYTSNFPAEPMRLFDNTRGHIVIEETSCIYCTLCAKKCPCDAITVTRPVKATDGKPEQKGSWAIDQLKCIGCGYCVEACNKNCLIMKGEPAEPQTSK